MTSHATRNPARRTRDRVVALLLGAIVWGGVTPRAVEIIDRVLAVVAGELITLSDLRAAERFGLVEATSGSGEERQRARLNLLIDRQLQLVEINRYGPPEPPAAVIDARLAALHGRFDAERGFEQALQLSGWSAERVRARIRDNVRIELYLDERFGSPYQPSDADLQAYYRANAPAFTVDGTVRPFESVRDEVRQTLVAERTRALVRDWLDGLRRRTEVTVLPPVVAGR